MGNQWSDMMKVENGGQGTFTPSNIDWNAINRANQQQATLREQQGTMAGANAARTAGAEQANPWIASYGKGDADLNTTLDALRLMNPEGVSGVNRDTARQAAENELATGPLTGSRFASEQIQSNPILGQLFGKGGTLEQSVGQVKDLSNRGYSLQPEDYEAYGQQSGNLARMFGQTEQNAAQSLSDRGLGQAASGAAGATFSGLQGNKNEQLGQLQTQIAQNRMNMNMQRLGQMQNFVSQLGGQAAGDIQQQYGRQLSGVQQQEANRSDTFNSLGAAAQGFGQQGMQNIQESGMGREQAQAAQNAANAAYNPSMGTMLGQGQLTSAYQTGSSPGQFSSSFSGAMGSSLGGGMMGGMGGGGGGSSVGQTQVPSGSKAAATQYQNSPNQSTYGNYA